MNNNTNREPLANRQKRIGANNEVLEEKKTTHTPPPHTNQNKNEENPPTLLISDLWKQPTNLGSTSCSKQH